MEENDWDKVEADSAAIQTVWRFEKVHFMEWRVKRKRPFSFLRHHRYANCSSVKSGAIFEIIQDLSRIFLSPPCTYKRNWNGTL